MIDLNGLEAKFARMGARIKIADQTNRWAQSSHFPVRLNVLADKDGEYYEVSGSREKVAQVEILDVQPEKRHLLVMVRENQVKHKFLCGHDERHWFVAALPDKAPVGNVRAAMESLKPAEVRAAQAREQLSAERGNHRKNPAFRRQGEWFFVPAPEMRADPKLVLTNEPISRGNGGKPHMCEFLYRTGGEPVYIAREVWGAYTEQERVELIKQRPEAANWRWTQRMRNAKVLVRGRVRHADHKTIMLNGWHRVLMNTENESTARSFVTFLD